MAVSDAAHMARVKAGIRPSLNGAKVTDTGIPCPVCVTFEQRTFGGDTPQLRILTHGPDLRPFCHGHGYLTVAERATLPDSEIVGYAMAEIRRVSEWTRESVRDETTARLLEFCQSIELGEM